MSRSKKKWLRKYMTIMHDICGIKTWSLEANLRHYKKRRLEANLDNLLHKGRTVPLI